MSDSRYSIRIANNSDGPGWDDFVSSHPFSSPYHLFAWKKAVEEAYGHKGYYLLAEENHKIKGILPLIHFHFPLLLNEFNALPFCDIGNVLCENEEISRLLFNECLVLGNKKNIKKMSLRGDLSFPPAHSDAFSAEPHDKVRMFLELPDSSEALMSSFKSKLRSQIRKAEKNGLIFSWGTEADLDSYYSVFSENMRDLGSPVHSKRWFQSILKHYAEHARMGIVRYQEETVGGCILLSAGDKIAIPWASTLRQYNKLAPNMLLYWNVLKYSADAGFSIFDFGRSSEGEGTYKFKKQWGAVPTPLNWYSYLPSPRQSKESLSRSGGAAKKKIANIWNKMPTPLANFFGPIIRKYISL